MRLASRLGILVGVAMTWSACVGQEWAPKPPADAPGGLEDVLGGSKKTYSYDRGEPGTPSTVSVDLERRYQTLVGFGASTAWYHDRITGKTPDGLYQVLFPELGLDVLRLRNRYLRSETNDRNLKTEVEILKRATEALGHRPLILITSWSPPSHLKASGKERCKGEDQCTLAKKNGTFVYEEFGQYWADSLAHYQSMGISPDFISMQNEPDFIPPDWEGCKFEPSETAKFPGYGKALDVVHGKLAQLPHRPQMIGPELLGIHYNKMPKFLAGLDVRKLDAVSHHLYERGNDGVWDWRDPGPDSYADEMRDIAATTQMPRYQTEFQTDEDEGFDGGLETAWLIQNSLVHEGVSMFLYWDLIWDGNAGLVGLMGRLPMVRDQYFAVRHFARFTDPGFVRVNAPTDNSRLIASAFVSPTGDRLTVVAINTGEQMLEVKVDPGAFKASSSAAYRTTFRPRQSERWTELGAEGIGDSLRMPPRSIVTLVMKS